MLAQPIEIEEFGLKREIAVSTTALGLGGHQVTVCKGNAQPVPWPMARRLQLSITAPPLGAGLGSEVLNMGNAAVASGRWVDEEVTAYVEVDHRAVVLDVIDGGGGSEGYHALNGVLRVQRWESQPGRSFARVVRAQLKESAS